MKSESVSVVSLPRSSEESPLQIYSNNRGNSHRVWSEQEQRVILQTEDRRAKNQKEIYCTRGPRQHFVHTYIHRKEKLRTHFTYLHTYIRTYRKRERERETIKDRVKWINNTSNNRRLAVAVASPTLARTWKLKQLSPSRSSSNNKAKAF